MMGHADRACQPIARTKAFVRSVLSGSFYMGTRSTITERDEGREQGRKAVRQYGSKAGGWQGRRVARQEGRRRRNPVVSSAALAPYGPPALLPSCLAAVLPS